jgi:hypothetical protein
MDTEPQNHANSTIIRQCRYCVPTPDYVLYSAIVGMLAANECDVRVLQKKVIREL